MKNQEMSARTGPELQQLKNAWLRRLQNEYENLAAPFQPGLRPATLALTRDKGFWGRWSERDRTIFINEELIANYPWAAVEGIMGHEIIHQAVSELGGSDAWREPPHGPTFKMFGASRGLHPFYLSASVDLRDACPRPLPEEDGGLGRGQSAQVMDKVQKLLALSNSPVPAEAQAALSAAARLMARHNLDLLDNAPENRAYEYRVIELGIGRRIEIRPKLIASLLGRHFFVQCIFTEGYDAARDKELKCLELVGRPENTRLAEHVFHFLVERTDSLWREYNKNHRGGGLVARNSFFLGLLKGFDQKLSEATAASADYDGGEEGFSALVLAKDQGLTRFFECRHPQVIHRCTGRRRYNPEAGSAGKEAGRALNLNRPVEKSPGGNQSETRLLS